MTNEEAIKNLQDFTGWFKKNKPIYEALEMAIKALEQKSTDKSNLEKICEELAAENDDLRDQLAMKDRFKTFPVKLQINKVSKHISNIDLEEFEQEPCDDNRLYIKVYADLEPQEKAEKLYQICGKEELLEVYKELGEYCDIEPCDDVVSREAVLDCATLITSIPTEDWDIGDWVCLFRDRVSQLPSVRPQPKIGHWLYSGENGVDRWTCDNCFDFVKKPTKVCPNCGAKMIEPQESEE